MTAPIQLIAGDQITSEQRSQAIDVLYEGFERKILRLFLLTDSEKQARRMLPPLLDFSRCIAAVQQERVVGVLFMNHGARRSFRFDWQVGRREFGLLGVLLRRANYWLVQEGRCKPDQIHLQAICVRSDMRSMGIGTQLIREAFSLAERKGCTRVTLKVVDTNPRALLLYQRLGFNITKSATTWPVTCRAGFKGYDYMVKALPSTQVVD